jgi:hypothetical protein
MDKQTLPQRALTAWHEDSQAGRVRRAVIVAGLLLAEAIALWPVSRSENIYKSVQNPQYKYSTMRVPSGEHPTVSCGPPILGLTKTELADDDETPVHACSDKAKGRVLVAGIVGGAFIVGAIWLVPVFVPERRRDTSGRFQV